MKHIIANIFGMPSTIGGSTHCRISGDIEIRFPESCLYARKRHWLARAYVFSWMFKATNCWVVCYSYVRIPKIFAPKVIIVSRKFLFIARWVQCHGGQDRLQAPIVQTHNQYIENPPEAEMACPVIHRLLSSDRKPTI